MFNKYIRASLIILLTTVLLQVQANDNIEVYNAYGNTHHLLIQGRMLQKTSFGKISKEDGWFKNGWRRLWQVKGNDIESHNITVMLKGEHFSTKGDDEGYFEFTITTKKSLNTGYEKIILNIEGNRNVHESNATIIGSGKLLGIISDFDDTLIISDVPNKIKFVAKIVFKNYKQREIVPGMLQRFEKILSQNPKGSPSTLFILSGSPQQLFSPIESFLNFYHFPEHILILKKAHGENLDPLIDQFAYKTKKVERLINLYPNMIWIMFGDSGEKDAEIYKAIKMKYPHKVKKYYIRDVKSGKIKEYNKL